MGVIRKDMKEKGAKIEEKQYRRTWRLPIESSMASYCKKKIYQPFQASIDMLHIKGRIFKHNFRRVGSTSLMSIF